MRNLLLTFWTVGSALFPLVAITLAHSSPMQRGSTAAQCPTGTIVDYPQCRETDRRPGDSSDDCDVHKDRPIGIYLGPSQLTSSYFDAWDTPIPLAKVSASQAWRSHALRVAKEGPPSCDPADSKYKYPDPEYGDCAEALPAFLDSMHRVVDASTAQLGYRPKIGFVVVPRSVRLSAAQRAFNLTNPDTLGVAWAEDGHENWRYEYDYYPEDIFADDDNYVLLALLELGEDNVMAASKTSEQMVQRPLGGGTTSSRVQRLSSGISDFMERTRFPLQKEMLKAVVVTGDASDMDSIWRAVHDALFFVDSWRFKTLNNSPGFVLSLGAAAEYDEIYT
ncbi:hypothetical protein NKR23_g9896 [Pleurostoma richardsiae]|uniref:Uncharacterized protein n=1 Tax=Pleurostoma richardsiae TaxID=41990 RepID=A0AA38VC37_9PEZI|nr:hypothetical protein NKR23_g9896 [Pleurostoma richardsiae]